MKNKLFCLLLIMCIQTASKAQTQNIGALKIGDLVPDITLPMINYIQDSIELSSLKGKLVILDFWSTYCSACLAQFPRFDSLQQKFKDKLFILPVGFDGYNRDAIKKFIEKRKGTSRELRLPSAVQHPDDSLLMKLFPFDGLPNEVWIDQNGKLKAVTDQFAVSEENIQNILSEKKVILPLKYVDQSFDISSPFLVNNNGGADSAFLFRSLITSYNPVMRGSIEEQTKKYTRVAITNQPPLVAIRDIVSSIYQDVPSRKQFVADYWNKRIVIESENPLLKADWYMFQGMQSSDIEAFRKKNFYVYETIMPPSSSIKNVYQAMLSNIESFFKIKVSIEQREIRCLVLSCMDCKEKLSTELNKPEVVYSEDNLQFTETNSSIDELISYINSFLKLDYAINETGYNKNIDINIALKKLDDLDGLNHTLERYGLILIPAERTVETLVIKNDE